MYQYPNTVNGHPTPIQHQYLAESILTALEKDGISTNIKII
jgi:phospholipase/lecithinase/hemolysin